MEGKSARSWTSPGVQGKLAA